MSAGLIPRSVKKPVQLMPEFLHLRFQIIFIEFIQPGQGWHALPDDNAEVRQSLDLVRVIGVQDHFLDSTLLQNQSRRFETSEVGFKTKLMIGFDGIRPLVLQVVGADLIAEPDTPAFLTQINNSARTTLLNLGEGEVQLVTAIAFQGTQDFAGKAFGMDADKGAGFRCKVVTYENR